MRTLKSQQFGIEQSTDRVLEFLSEPKNYGLLLPKNKHQIFNTPQPNLASKLRVSFTWH